MGRAYAIAPAEWPKIAKQLEAGDTAENLAETHGVSTATIYKIRDRVGEGEQPKAANGKPVVAAKSEQPIAPTNGAMRKLLTPEASAEVVMPQIVEWIGSYYKTVHDPAGRARLRRANEAIILLAANIHAEL